MIHMRRSNHKSHVAGFAEVHPLAVISTPIRKNGRHEFSREMGFTPGRPPTYLSIGGCVCFWKPIASERCHHLPDPFSRLDRHATFFLRLIDKLTLQLLHLFAGVEMTHRAA